TGGAGGGCTTGRRPLPDAREAGPPTTDRRPCPGGRPRAGRGPRGRGGGAPPWNRQRRRRRAWRRRGSRRRGPRRSPGSARWRRRRWRPAVGGRPAGLPRLLPRSPAGRPAADVAWEPAYLRRLAATGFPAPRPLGAFAGASWLAAAGAVWGLVSFLPGRTL